MLIVDKIAQALSVIDYPSYRNWLDVHEYNDNLESKVRWKECKAYKKVMLACFTETELRDLFILTNGKDIKGLYIMKTIHFQDKFNPIKFWIVTRTNCRHYTITQALYDSENKVLSKPLYNPTRERLYRISELLWQDKQAIKAMFK